MHHRPTFATRSDSGSQLVRVAHDVEVVRGGDGRTIHGILVPWDTPTRVADAFGPSGRLEQYDEAIARGAFPDAVANPSRVKFLAHHDKRSNPLGRGELIRDDAAGLYGEFRVSKTVSGDEVLELVRDGALDAFSVGFSPITSRSVDGVYVRQYAHLNETSIVTFGAYAGALVGGVRSHDLTPTPDGPLGAGEPSAEGGSGDQQEAPPTRSGMTHQERDRALHLLSLGGLR